MFALLNFDLVNDLVVFFALKECFAPHTLGVIELGIGRPLGTDYLVILIL